MKYSFVPSLEKAGRDADPSEVICRSPFASWIQTELWTSPTDDISERPSGAIAIPSCSVGPKVNCSAAPPFVRCRHMWYPVAPAFEFRYIHSPSGDQAAYVHEPFGGPTCFPGELPSKGTTRHGSHPSLSISTTNT